MKLSVKTLQGTRLSVEVEADHTWGTVKESIEAQNNELKKEGMKLILKGKVLKDDGTVEGSGVTEKDFVVCMISKKARPSSSRKAVVPSSSSSAAPAATGLTPASPSTTQTTNPTPAAGSGLTTATESQTAAHTQQQGSAASTTTDPPPTVSQAAVSALVEMGFSEAQASQALSISGGNAAAAIEYLSDPPSQSSVAAVQLDASATTTTTEGGEGLESLNRLRQHPDFDQLRLMVQQDPGSLQRVLAVIGQQDPALLAAIHSNQAEFVQMMNEPVAERTATTPAQATAAAATTIQAPGSMANVMQSGAGMLQQLQNMPPEARAQMASDMGMNLEQLQQVTQLMANMPREQFQQLLEESMAGRMGGAMAGGMGGGTGAGGALPPTIQLAEDEMQAVDRLCELGYDRLAAIQVYLACDKNESLAANLLMDGMGNDFLPPNGGDNGGGGPREDADRRDGSGMT